MSDIIFKLCQTILLVIINLLTSFILFHNFKPIQYILLGGKNKITFKFELLHTYLISTILRMTFNCKFEARKPDKDPFMEYVKSVLLLC